MERERQKTDERLTAQIPETRQCGTGREGGSHSKGEKERQRNAEMHRFSRRPLSPVPTLFLPHHAHAVLTSPWDFSHSLNHPLALSPYLSLFSSSQILHYSMLGARHYWNVQIRLYSFTGNIKGSWLWCLLLLQGKISSELSRTCLAHILTLNQKKKINYMFDSFHDKLDNIWQNLFSNINII